MDNTIIIPVTATYRIVDGEPIMVDAEYAEVSVDAMARFLLNAFHVPTEEGMP